MHKAFDHKTQKLISMAFFMCILIFTILASAFYFDSRTGDCGQVEYALANKINPNSASAASLTRLPGIGPSRANSIIQYRRQNRRQDGIVFQKPDDLQKIKGIGPKTVENVRDFLIFD